MNFKKILTFTCLGTLLCGAATACTKSTPGGEDTLQIRCYKGGYGDDWLKELAKQFEKTFPGKKVEIVESSANVTEKSKNEILVPKKNNIDLYFTNGSNFYSIIEQSKKVLKTSGQVLLEDLTDVYNSKAIGFDGKEESETIASRMFAGYKEQMSYNGSLSKWVGKVYKLSWADAMTGLIANVKVLNKYGLDIPVTTNDLVNCIETIAAHTKDDKIYPYSWAGSNCPGYWSYLFETWFAQYSSSANYRNFMKCEPSSGDIQHEGYKVYEDVGILKGLEQMYEILDLRYSSNGSASKQHMTAQNEFLRGESGFIVDGDWMLDEMKDDYFEEAKDIRFMKTPILSVIGTECGLTEAEFKAVVVAVDEGKTDAELKALQPKLTDANIKRIRDARAVYDCIGVTHDMFIPSYADAKDTAKLFMRFMYSNDGCRVFRNKAYANLPLSYHKEAGDANTPYQQSLDKIYQGQLDMISGSGDLNSVRSLSGLLIFNVSEWAHPVTYKAIMIDKNSSKPAYSAQKIFEGEANYVKESWKNYMEYIY